MTTAGYQRDSALRPDERASLLSLETALGATPAGLVEHPRFFSGFVAQPVVLAAGLLAVADVAATRYYDLSAARRATLDPVVTASGDRLRFEAMSACNGVYARFDLLGDGIDAADVAFGTTNVDVNQPLRTALARVGHQDLLHVSVGADDVAVATPQATHVERKVDLPDRWVRGLAEAPAVAAGMSQAAEVGAAASRTFLAGLPRSAPGLSLAVAPTARGLQATSSATPGAVSLAGTARLTAARRVSRFVSRLRVYGSPSGASGWVLDVPGGRLTLVLTPEPYRGFSGEGGLLSDLAGPGADDDAAVVLEYLAWEPVIDPTWIGAATGLPLARVARAISRLASSGRVGYDLAEQASFHRELPHDGARAERDNPRLLAARALAAEGAVRPDGRRWRVGHGAHQSWVELTGARARCTCVWWARYEGGRGPCKHVLAVAIACS